MLRYALALAALLLFLATGCQGTEESSPPAVPKVLRLALAVEPGSLEPGRAVDEAAFNVVYNTGDPLVKLDEDFEAAPNLAESWEWSHDGSRITFHLRKDGRWTNGDPVTARDFEWSWKRVVSPGLAAEWAYQLYGIVGARAYNECGGGGACPSLRNKVGIVALDDSTLRVTLTSPQPWFPQLVAHHAFLAVNRPTVERFGPAWTDPENIVTNGPFKLASWVHDKSVVLVKNRRWRNADQVALDRVEAAIVPDSPAQVRAFRRNVVDATDGGSPIPRKDVESLTASGDLVTYPSLGTTYYGFNLKNINDVNQRRAMAFAVDRAALNEAMGQDRLPATGFIPPGMPGFDTITGDFLPSAPDLARAREYMSRARHPKLRITLFLNDQPDAARPGAIAREAWKQLGIETRIRVLDWARFLEAMGPPPSKEVDAVHIGWIGDYIDAYNFFEILSCGSESNWWNFCDKTYDRLLEKAGLTSDPRARYRIYAQLEAILTGREGPLPIAPTLWFTVASLEKPSVRETFNVDPLYHFDLTQVEIKR